jgi:septum formation protein
MHDKTNFSFILASKSPRRRELLKKAGYRFKPVSPNVDETAFDTSISPAEFAKALALAKAKSVAQNYKEKIVVGADTIVDFDGRIIGKAAGEADAEKIVRLLFSRPHKVITGLAIVRLKDNLEIVESDTTVVYPKSMTDEQIAEHIESGTWRDKAGAYAIQETGDQFVEKITGSLTNVMGMPMELFDRLFKKYILDTDSFDFAQDK